AARAAGTRGAPRPPGPAPPGAQAGGPRPGPPRRWVAGPARPPLGQRARMRTTLTGRLLLGLGDNLRLSMARACLSRMRTRASGIGGLVWRRVSLVSTIDNLVRIRRPGPRRSGPGVR